MKTIKEKLVEAEKLFTDAKALLSKEDATAEDKTNAAQMITDAKALQGECAQLQDIVDAAIAREALLKRGGSGSNDDDADDNDDGDDNPPEEFKGWEDFLTAVWQKQAHGRPDERLRYFRDEKVAGHGSKQMAEGTGASGGFLVPVQFLPQLQAIQAEDSIVRSRATIIRMQRRQIAIPVLDQTGTTAGIPHWFGGMRFYWQAEASAKTLTEASFRKVNLVAHKLIGYTYASDELVEDSVISLADFLSGPLGFAGGVAWMEDYAMLMGTGAGQPRGVVNAPATIGVARAAAGGVSIADLAGMMQAFLPSGRGVWVMSQSVLSTLIQLSGPTGNPYYFWQPSLREGVPGLLFGLPVIWTEKVPVLGTRGDVGLYDFRYYLVGDRQATTVESTPYDRWQYDETSWRVTHRCDGQPWLSSPLTLQDGSTQISPFVALTDAATS